MSPPIAVTRSSRPDFPATAADTIAILSKYSLPVWCCSFHPGSAPPSSRSCFAASRRGFKNSFSKIDAALSTFAKRVGSARTFCRTSANETSDSTAASVCTTGSTTCWHRSFLIHHEQYSFAQGCLFGSFTV